MKSIRSISEAQTVLNDLINRIDTLSLKNWDRRQTRITNAHPSVDPYDYVVRKELDAVREGTTEVTSTVEFYDKATFGIGIDIGAVTGVNVCPPYIASFNLIPTICYYTAAQFPTGSSVIVSPKLNGVSLFTTDIAIPVGGSGVYEKSDFTVTSISKKDIITCDVTQIGSGLPGLNIVIVLRFKVVEV